MTHHIIHHAGQVKMMLGIFRPLRSTGDRDKIAETSTSLKQAVLHLLHCGTYQVFCQQSILHMHPTAVTICEQSLNRLTNSSLKHFMHYSPGAMGHGAIFSRMHAINCCDLLPGNDLSHTSVKAFPRAHSRPLTLHMHCNFSHCLVAA